MTVELNEPEEVMLKRLASLEEGPHFRHQTRDEPPLSQEEKMQIARDLLQRNPGEFLARYHRFLCWPDDAVCFSRLWSDYTVAYYLKEVVGIPQPAAQPSPDLDDEDSNGTVHENLRRRRELQVKNRRLVALRRMEAEAEADPTDGFFSHEAMRERDPVLWERMVGRHLTDAERRSLLGHQYKSFSGMLLSQLMESEGMPERLPYDTDGEEDGDDSDEDMLDREEWRARKKVIEEKNERARQEFREIMYSRFLSGKDATVDYDAIDNDVTLDDELEERGRDAEESYFDAESPAPAPPLEDPLDMPDAPK